MEKENNQKGTSLSVQRPRSPILQASSTVRGSNVKEAQMEFEELIHRKPSKGSVPHTISSKREDSDDSRPKEPGSSTRQVSSTRQAESPSVRQVPRRSNNTSQDIPKTMEESARRTPHSSPDSQKIEKPVPISKTEPSDFPTQQPLHSARKPERQQTTRNSNVKEAQMEFEEFMRQKPQKNETSASYTVPINKDSRQNSREAQSEPFVHRKLPKDETSRVDSSRQKDSGREIMRMGTSARRRTLSRESATYRVVSSGEHNDSEIGDSGNKNSEQKERIQIVVKGGSRQAFGARVKGNEALQDTIRQSDKTGLRAEERANRTGIRLEAAETERMWLEEPTNRGEYNLKRLKEPGTAGFRIAAIEKTEIKLGTLFLTKTAVHGTDAGRGIDEIHDTAGTVAEFAVDNVRIMLAHSLEKDLSRNLGHYHDMLEEMGGERALLQFGVSGKIVNPEDLRRLQQGVNRYLISRYGVGIKGTGTLGYINAWKFIAKNKDSLDEETVNLIRQVFRNTSGSQLLSGRATRLRAINRMGFRRIGRYLRQTDAGYGAFFALTLLSKGRSVLRGSIYAIRAVGKVTMRATLIAAKAAAKASVKAAKAAAKFVPNSVKTNPRVVKGMEKGKKVVANGKTAAGKGKKLFDRAANPFREFRTHYREFRRDPFGVRAGMHHVGDRAKDAVVGRLEKTFLKKPIYFAKKVFYVPKIIGSAIAKATAAVSSFVTAIINLILIAALLLAGFLMLTTLISFLVSMIADLFNFAGNEEEIVNAALEQIEESYQGQVESIAALQSRYRNVSVSYEDIKDFGEYEGNDISISETTNSAELLAMATVYFDFDLEDAGKQRVKDYIRKLYNGSHQLTIIENPQVLTNANGEEYTVYDADVTLTTYYFNDLFDCELSDSPGFLHTGTIVAGTTIEVPQTFEQCITVTEYDKWVNSWGVAPGTNQRLISEVWTEQGQPFDNGLAYITTGSEKRYLIAMVDTFGVVGDYVDIYLANGTVLPCVLADAKSRGDANITDWGHVTGNAVSVLEMEVQSSVFQQHGNPGSAQWWPELSSRVVKVVNGGSYFANPSGPSSALTSTAQVIINTARNQLGKPYVYGATGPDSFDCSGLVQYCYAAAGISIPRTAEAIADEGQAVSTPQPGDICCTPGHVGIYIGNDQMIEAQQDGVPICVSQVRADKFVRFASE